MVHFEMLACLDGSYRSRTIPLLEMVVFKIENLTVDQRFG